MHAISKIVLSLRGAKLRGAGDEAISLRPAWHFETTTNPYSHAGTSEFRIPHPGCTCGAGHAGDLCTCTTFHLPSRFTITRLSLCAFTCTPSGNAVLVSRV